MKRPQADSPKHLRYRLRRRRFKLVEDLIKAELKFKTTVSILDMGGRLDYWRLLEERYHESVSITIVNLEDEISLQNRRPHPNLETHLIAGDATNLSNIKDQEYDIAHSNSVIEHVGLYSSMAKFAAETRRVAHAYYVQTPNFWFPLEPHYGLPFFHWLPEPTRFAIHSQFGAGYAPRTDEEGALQRIDHTRIISRGLMKHFFPDAEHMTERLSLFPKSLIAVRRSQHCLEKSGG